MNTIIKYSSTCHRAIYFVVCIHYSCAYYAVNIVNAKRINALKSQNHNVYGYFFFALIIAVIKLS